MSIKDIKIVDSLINLDKDKECPYCHKMYNDSSQFKLIADFTVKEPTTEIKMSDVLASNSAKYMFEELGFEQAIDSETHIGYIGMYRGKECIINFYPLAKTYAVHTTYVIDKELHRAITQQLKELEEK